MNSREMFLCLQITFLLGNVVISSFQTKAELNSLITENKATDYERSSSLDDDRTSGNDYKTDFPSDVKSLPVRALSYIIRQIHLDADKDDDNSNMTSFGSLIGGSINYNFDSNEENNTDNNEAMWYAKMAAEYNSHFDERTDLMGNKNSAGYARLVGGSNTFIDILLHKNVENTNVNQNMDNEDNITQTTLYENGTTNENGGITPMPNSICPGCVITKTQNTSEVNNESTDMNIH